MQTLEDLPVAFALHAGFDRSPGEVAATIYKALGVPLELELPGAQGRPIPLVERGIEPINELFV